MKAEDKTIVISETVMNKTNKDGEKVLDNETHEKLM
jgi:hypothetical protein